MTDLGLNNAAETFGEPSGRAYKGMLFSIAVSSTRHIYQLSSITTSNLSPISLLQQPRSVYIMPDVSC